MELFKVQYILVKVSKLVIFDCGLQVFGLSLDHLFLVCQCLTYDWMVFRALTIDSGHGSPYSKYVCDTP